MGQGYDGASNMSGSISGLQVRFKKLHPLALYTYSSDHVINSDSW